MPLKYYSLGVILSKKLTAKSRSMITVVAAMFSTHSPTLRGKYTMMMVFMHHEKKKHMHAEITMAIALKRFLPM
jgi:hypothetical protein